MTVTSVLFDIPEHIQQGLDAGIFKRYGGVIKETGNGHIHCWLKETGLGDGLKDLPKNIDGIGARMAGLERMQMLNLAGLAGVAVICVAGFVYLGAQIAAVRKQLESMEVTLGDIKYDVEWLKQFNIVSLADGYYEVRADFQEKDYAEALKHTRSCSARIENYFRNMPADKIFTDEQATAFLTATLCGAMQCQLAAASLANPDSLVDVAARYHALFAKLGEIIAACKKNAFSLKALPTAETLKLHVLRKNPDSFLNRLTRAIPVALETLEQERLLLELRPTLEPAALEQIARENPRYPAAMNPGA